MKKLNKKQISLFIYGANLFLLLWHGSTFLLSPMVLVGVGTMIVLHFLIKGRFSLMPITAHMGLEWYSWGLSWPSLTGGILTAVLHAIAETLLLKEELNSLKKSFTFRVFIAGLAALVAAFLLGLYNQPEIVRGFGGIEYPAQPSQSLSWLHQLSFGSSLGCVATHFIGLLRKNFPKTARQRI